MEKSLKTLAKAFFLFFLFTLWGCGCPETKKHPPQAPTNLTAAAGNSAVTLTWQASAGATGYNIYMGSPDCTSVTFVTITTGTSIQVTDLTNGTPYCFVVRAYNADGESGPSNQATATPMLPLSPPQPPTALTAMSGNTIVTLSWQASTGATGYNVYMGSPDCTSVTSVTTTTGTSIQVTGLTNGTPYCFVVRAYNADGESANSNQATATPINADIIFTYQNPTIPPGGGAPTGIPLNGATNVPLNIIITGTSTDTDVLTISSTTFTMTVTDGSSTVAGRIEISYNYSSVIFIPGGFLKPNTTYTIIASQSNYFTTASFTTIASVSNNLASVGQGYALKIPPGGITQPPGLAPILEPVIQSMNTVLATVDIQQVTSNPDSGFIQFTVGQGNATQTALIPGSLVFPFSGPYLGPYIHLNGSMVLNAFGYTLTVDSFDITGTFADWSAYGGTGVGITDGTLTEISNCADLPPVLQPIVLPYCTNTGLLIIVGSYYATPFTVTAAKDINGATLTATVTSPVQTNNVPITTPITADIGKQGGGVACIAVTTTSVLYSLRDWQTGALVSGTTLTTTSAVPSCTLDGNGQIIGASFLQTTPPLLSGRTYRALTVLDLSPVTGTTFTTQ